MLLKDIQKPNNFDEFLEKKDFWHRKHTRNANTKVENIFHPHCLGDKLSWCVIYGLYNEKLFNKIEAKDEIEKILGTNEYTIPTYQICNNGIEGINWNDLLGKSFVIKPGRGALSHGVIVQKTNLKQKDIRTLVEKVNADKYLPYKKYIIIEKYIGSKTNKGNFQTDYKFWCLNGKPVFVLVVSDRVGRKHCSNFFDLSWKPLHLDRVSAKENDKKRIRKPKNFDKMIEIATKICQNMPCVRVDLYNINGKIYFGECQKIYGFHCRFSNFKQNLQLGEMFNLNDIKIDFLKKDCMDYDVKISQQTQEAKDILGCCDDEFEFCYANDKTPIYYNNNEPQKGIFKDNGKWYCMENDDFSDMNNDICPLKEKIFNKKNQSFEKCMIKEAKTEFNTFYDIDCDYDDNGDIVYYNKLEDNICIKYVNGHWIKNEYENIKVPKF